MAHASFSATVVLLALLAAVLSMPAAAYERHPLLPPRQIARVLAPRVPSAVDWRSKGFVSAPINCGMCPAVTIASAVATNIAGTSAVKHGKFIDVSLAEIVGCGMGGKCGETLADFGKIYEWFLTHTDGQVVSSEAQPWGGQPSTCNTSGAVAARFTELRRLPHDEMTIASFVASNGPVAAVIDATPFQMYTGGVLPASSCGPSPRLNNAVSIVGYSMKPGQSPPFWILKFSWGPAFGEGGYARVEFGKNACGVTDMVVSSIAA